MRTRRGRYSMLCLIVQENIKGKSLENLREYDDDFRPPIAEKPEEEEEV